MENKNKELQLTLNQLELRKMELEQKMLGNDNTPFMSPKEYKEAYEEVLELIGDVKARLDPK